MANANRDAQTVDTEQAAAQTTEEKKPASPAKHTVARLRRDCFRVFGVTTSTFDGATFGMKGTYTVEEMKAHLKKWGETPVSTAKADQKEAEK